MYYNFDIKESGSPQGHGGGGEEIVEGGLLVGTVCFLYFLVWVHSFFEIGEVTSAGWTCILIVCIPQKTGAILMGRFIKRTEFSSFQTTSQTTIGRLVNTISIRVIDKIFLVRSVDMSIIVAHWFFDGRGVDDVHGW